MTDEIKPVNRVIYKLRSRNLRFGVYDEQTGMFIGIRTKFDATFLDSETYERTAWPLEAVGRVPDDVMLREREDADPTCGNCGKRAWWTGPPAPAPWACEGGCDETSPWGPGEYMALRKIMDQIEEQHG